MKAPLASLFLAALAATAPAAATDVTVAVAANFRAPFEIIARRFEAATGYGVAASYGATGKHYAQIRNGAPFQAFLAADRARPRRLEAAGEAVAGSRFTYAVGRLVLWSPRADFVDPGGRVLEEGNFRHLAVANPRLAPYGRAAAQVLRSRGLERVLAPRLVRGENIAQTFQFVASGNAELGFVAASQVARDPFAGSGSRWDVPTHLHTPIEQQAVLLKEHEPARALLQFLRSAPARDVIEAHGYGTGGGETPNP